MNYDDWKTEAPEEAPTSECRFCGAEIPEEGYCSRECYVADINDTLDDDR